MANSIKIDCVKCGRNVVEGNYYKMGGAFKDVTKYGHFPVCKKCIEVGFNVIPPRDYTAQKDYLVMICQLLNKPFIKGVFEASKTEEKPFRYFMSNISNSKNRGKEFRHSIGITDMDGIGARLTPDQRDKWAPYNGLDDAYLLRAEGLYTNIKKESSIVDNVDNTSTLCNLVILKLRIADEVTNGDPKSIKDMQGTVKVLEGNLGITSVKEKAGGHKSFGQLIESLENEDPYFGPQERYEDVDALLLSSKAILGSTSVAFGKTDKVKFREAHYKNYEV